MGANTFGNRFCLTSFGESHGVGLGVIIDGCPAGVPFDFEFLKGELARRRPGTSAVVTARQEDDLPEVLSGVYEGVTLGTPIAIVVRNKDQRSHDYSDIPKRTGHADDVWRLKFGHSDLRGGGRSSGRETIARVMAGAVAQMMFRRALPELKVTGFAREIGPFKLSPAELTALAPGSNARIDAFTARFPSATSGAAIEELLVKAKQEGKSYGGLAEIWIDGTPLGLGQPVFHKLKADLASAILGVGATAGVEIGEGFEAREAEGSEFHSRNANATPYGGIRGGISTGERIVIRAAFKPTASVLDVAKKGRHDPCIVPRAIPVLESMAWNVLADHYLWAKTDRI
jgi:chorismate synthase